MQIEVKNLSYVYSAGLPFETAALTDVSFSADSGSFVCIIGHTGSGKSTLIQHLNGLVKPTAGEILIDGKDINTKGKEGKALRNKVGLVFQYPEYQLFEENVLLDVCFGPKNLGFNEEECSEKAIRALKLVGLPEYKYKASPFALSGGEKRRVAIAGVLAMEPEILILDEPTAGLDPQGQREILDMIDRIRAEKDITVFMVSHNMEDVARLADKVLVLSEGKLILQGSPAEVFAHTAELKEAGLGLPAPTAFLKLLEAKGLNVNGNILFADEAEAEILKALGKDK